MASPSAGRAASCEALPYSPRIEQHAAPAALAATVGAMAKGCRPSVAPEAKRTKQLTAYLTEGQHADMLAVAAQWDVTASLATYAVLADFLAEARRVALEHGESIGVGAAAVLLSRLGWSVAPPERARHADAA